MSRRRATRIALAAGALTAWDVFLDPRMARDGYWVWPQGGRYEGVPASNFVGWFVTGPGSSRSGRALDADDAPPPPATAPSPSTRGPGSARPSPTRCSGAGRASRGGRAMGAFAVPALAARMRAMRIAVVGAGVGGLAAAVRLAHAGHA